MLSSPESTTRGEPSSLTERGPRRRTSWPGAVGPAGVEEHGIGTPGSPGTWDALWLPLDKNWRGAVAKYDPANPNPGLEWKVQRFDHDGAPMSAIKVPASHIAVGVQTRMIWVQTKEGILRIDQDGKTLLTIPLPAESRGVKMVAF